MLGLFFSTFALIFVAELGDKTQLAALAVTSRSENPQAPWVIFAASSLALVCTSALAVAAGSIVGRALPPAVVRWGAGMLFLLAGLWILWKG